MTLPISGYNKKLIVNTLATILLMEGVAMIPAVAMAFYDGQRDIGLGMGVSFVILLCLGLMGKRYSKGHHDKIKISESYFIVLICWLTAIIGGMIPYLLAGNDFTFINAFFESAATWTTTNAWVVDINALPRALVLWKAISRLLGGMGIILLTIIIFSALGVGGQKLVGAEIAGPELEKHTARMADTAKMLYGLYGAGALLEALLLRVMGLPLFDSIINAMSTISTSGTMDYHGALSAHFTPGVKIVIVVFSILASLNFAIFIKLIHRKTKEAFMDFEMHVFFIILAVSTLFVGGVLYLGGYYDTVRDALINAITGVVSFSCTTGFTIEHVELWPTVIKFVLVILMIIGGCATSTAGGLKVIRFAIFVKLIGRGVYKRIHPRAVKPVLLRDVPVSTANASSVSTFILLFFGVYLLGSVLLSLENFDMETTLTAPIALLTNCGEGFGMVSGAGFGIFSAFGKSVCVFLMLFGRLEMYALLILFSRSFWNPNRTA